MSAPTVPIRHDAPRRVGIVFGTRPEAIKLAPVIRAFQAAPAWEPVIIVTGQHREMLDSVLATFDLATDDDLDIFAAGQSLTEITANVLARLPSILRSHDCDLVVVQGDTTTTFASALAAFESEIDVAHVEAGLRTFDPRAPFPEEINRRLTTQLASYHFAPTASNRENLVRENVPEDRIFVTGNTVIDALMWAAAQPLEEPCPVLVRLAERARRVVLVTVHRRESWGSPLEAVARGLARIAAAEPEVDIVVPAHPNPIVRGALRELEDLDNVMVCDPLPYLPFVHLLTRADLVVTDSGGIQEEAPSLGKPVLVVRDTTERPEAVRAGTVRVVGTDERVLVESIDELLHDASRYERMARAVNPYGDGRGSARILAGLDFALHGGPRPLDFEPCRD